MRDAALVLAVLSVAACHKNPPLPEGYGEESQPRSLAVDTPTPAPVAAADPALTASQGEASTIFRTRCTVCHGSTGAGDGPASAGLTPHPRDLTDKGWQSQVTDDHIEKIIQYGGIAVGKGAAMPPNPDLMSKPMVVSALTRHIRLLAR